MWWPMLQRLLEAVRPSRVPLVEPPDRIAGTRIHSMEIPSRYLRVTREVQVWTPPGYESDPGRRYPVLYLHDGQNLFFPENAFAGQIWNAASIAEDLVNAGEVEPFLIAGLAHGAERRIDEYTPSRDRRRARGGLASRHLSFLFEEVMPAVAGHFRVDESRERTALGGSSLGALISLHAMLSAPHRIGSVIAMSPSVWWDGRRVLRTIAASRIPAFPRVWTDIGTEEGAEAVDGARALRDALNDRGWQPGRSLHYAEYAGAGHTESAWRARLPEALRFVFGMSS